MANAPSDTLDQTRQTGVQMATPSSQVGDDIGNFEQSKDKEKMNTAFSQVLVLLNKRHSRDQKTRLRQAWETYRIATFFSEVYRTAACLEANQVMSLDTATASNIAFMELMSDREKRALDAYRAILKIMRADRAIFAEIEEASHKVLSLSDGTPYSKVLVAKVHALLEGLERERSNMDSFLVELSEYSA